MELTQCNIVPQGIDRNKTYPHETVCCLWWQGPQVGHEGLVGVQAPRVVDPVGIELEP